MPHGADWTAYPWGNATGTYYDSTWGYTSAGTSAQFIPTWYAHTGGQTYEYNWPQQQQIAEKIESAIDWLKRRVTEITDLAYAEV